MMLHNPVDLMKIFRLFLLLNFECFILLLCIYVRIMDDIVYFN